MVDHLLIAGEEQDGTRESGASDDEEQVGPHRMDSSMSMATVALFTTSKADCHRLPPFSYHFLQMRRHLLDAKCKGV